MEKGKTTPILSKDEFQGFGAAQKSLRLMWALDRIWARGRGQNFLNPKMVQEKIRGLKKGKRREFKRGLKSEGSRKKSREDLRKRSQVKGS